MPFAFAYLTLEEAEKVRLDQRIYRTFLKYQNSVHGCRLLNVYKTIPTKKIVLRYTTERQTSHSHAHISTTHFEQDLYPRP